MKTFRALLLVLLGPALAACPATPEDFCGNCYPGESVFVCNLPTSNNMVCAYGLTDAITQCGGTPYSHHICAAGTSGQNQQKDPYASWNPGAYVDVDPQTGHITVDGNLLDEIARDGYVLFAKDSARLERRGQGYFKLTDVAQGDLAHLLGFRSGEVIISVNGNQLVEAEDYAAAIVSEHQATQLLILSHRDGASRTTTIDIQ